MAQQTAVEQLVNYMKENFHLTDEALEMFEQALQMESDKAFEIFKAGQDSMEEGGKGFEQYYNETYETRPKSR